MKEIIGFFVQRHLFANLFTLSLILLGLSALFTIKRDIYPEVDFGEMVIVTSYPGGSPEDVEVKVTNKIEEELKQVTGIKRYVSFSMENQSRISVVIDPNEPDQDRIKQDVRDAVDRVNDFPVEVDESPLVQELKSSIFPVIEVGLTGNIPYSELRDLAWQFEKKLKDIPGVARVERFGWKAREIKIEIDAEKMQALQIPMREVVAAIRQRNIRSSGGTFESYTAEKNIVTLAQFRKPQEVGDVIIRSTFEGPLVRVSDLAVVRDDFEETTRSSRLKGREAISFIVNKSSSADIIRTVSQIKNLIEQFEASLPPEVKILYSNDESSYVSSRFRIVASNGLLGLTLVIVVLTLFLNFRTAFWVALGIPVAVLGSIFLLPAFGLYIDSLILTAFILIVGIIVDDAIIVSENIYHRFEQGETGIEAAKNGTAEVFAPVVTTILTTFLAFAPMLFMPGVMGKFVWVIPLTISLALFISLIEVTLILPAHLVSGLSTGTKTGKSSSKSSFFNIVRKRYFSLIKKLLRFPQRYIVVGIFIAVLCGLGLYAAKFMNFVLFPSSGSDRFFIAVETEEGTSLAATGEQVGVLEALIEALPESELESYVTRLGIKTHLLMAAERENYALLIVNLSPFADRVRTADQIVEGLREKVKKLENFKRISFEIDSGGPPVGRPITVRVVAADDNMRVKLAEEIIGALNNIAGVKDVDRDGRPGKEQLELVLDYDSVARSKLTVADIAQSIRIAYEGEVVTDVRYGEEDVDFRVQLPKANRGNLEYLKQLLIPNSDGRLIPLSQVASLKSVAGPASYYHYNGERATTITGDVDKSIITPLQATSMIMQNFDLKKDYPGARVFVGGEAEETQESVNALFVALGIAAIGIYFLLTLLFNSFLQPLLVMGAVPFGIIGVLIAFILHAEPLGFLAVMGIIGLAGVVVNDSLVLVSHVNDLKRTNPDLTLYEIVALGSQNRLRAIVLTTLTTVVGLLPLAYGLGGADPYMGPMALALGYGLLFATPLTLVLLPCLYLIGEDLVRYCGLPQKSRLSL